MIILNLIQNIALLVALAAAYQVIGSRFQRKDIRYQIVSGLLFGGVGLVGMMTPLHFMPGIIFDGRSIILSASGLFGGPVVAALAMTICGVYRLWLGGAGALVGFGVIFESAAIGVVFYFLWKDAKSQIGAFRLYIFGLLVHVVMLTLMLALPGGAGIEVLRKIGLPILLVYPLCTMLVCRIFLDYERQLHDRKALRQSEERYRAVFENAAVGIDLVADDGRILQANESLASMLGYSKEELLNLTFLDISHPDDLEVSRLKHERMVRGATDSYRFEKRYLRKDGEIVWADVSVSPVREPGGGHVATIGIITDVTDRKKAEEARRESDERFRIVFERAPLGVALVGLDYRLLRANKAYCDLLGYSEEELRKLHLSDFTHPDDLEENLRLQKELGSGRIPGFQLEKRFIRKDGRIATGLLVASLVSDKAGGPLHYLGMVLDITDRKKAEQARLRLAAAVEQAAEAVLITDDQGTIVYVNPSFERSTGYSREEVVGNNPRILKSGQHHSTFYRQMWNTIKEGHVWSGRFINRRKDGQLFTEDATISPVKDSSGNINNFVAVKRDITEHLELSRQLFQAQKMEAVGTLAGGVAHDFNNILQVVLGYSELMLSDEALPGQFRSDLRKVYDSARRGADLVHRLLTFSRKAEIRLQPLNLNRRIEDLRNMLERTLPKMIAIQLLLGEGLATINADPTQIDQILMNLAVNARDAMPDGGKLTIETANFFLDEEYAKTHLEAGSGLHVLLTVTDTGVGMDKETLQHIFEPFYTTKGLGEGTGLGLAMVHGIVKHHGGHVGCYSEPGQGTTFKIYLPALVSDDDLEAAAVVTIPRGGSETILLVDDEEIIRDLGARILTKAGYKVITASDGEEAVDIYQRRADEISLVILDVIMPKMGGKGCLEALLRLNPLVKVIISSGFSANGPTKDALAAGARGFVNKPHNMGQLLQTVRQVLDET